MERSKEQLGGHEVGAGQTGSYSAHSTCSLLITLSPHHPRHLCFVATDDLGATVEPAALDSKGASKIPLGQEANLKSVPSGRPDHQAARPSTGDVAHYSRCTHCCLPETHLP